jgi:DNA repair protein SbcC/Rad50
MQITYVTLKNAKSYSDSETVVRFADHVNLIKGENGAGKTTLLEAIGFVLFDTLPYSAKDFLRRGAKRGEILVGIVSALDEREYEVVREIGSSSKVYVYDPQLRQKLAEGKDDTTDWLRDHLQLDTLADPGSLFEDVIGVAQGTMTAIFTESTTTRETKFNKLLRVESYRDAFKKLNDTARYIDSLIQKNTEDQKILEGILRALPDQEDEYARLTETLNIDQSALGRIQERLVSVETELTHYKLIQQKLETLLHQIDANKLQLDQIQISLTRAEEDVNKAEVAQQVLTETAEDYRTYQESEKQLKLLEVKQRECEQLQTEKLRLEGELRESRIRLEHNKSELVKVDQAAEDMSDLLSQVHKQESLEVELVASQESLRELQRLEKQIVTDTAEAERLTNIVHDLETALSQRTQLETLLIDLKTKRGELDTQQEELDQQHTLLMQDRSDLQPLLKAESQRAQKYQLEQHTLERCQQDILQETENVERLRIVLSNRTKIGLQRDELQAQLQAAQNSESDAKAALKNLQQQLQELERRQSLLESDAALCPVCQRPMDEHARSDAQEHYTREANQLQDLITKTSADEKEAVELINSLSPQIQTLNATLEKMETEVSLQQSEQKLADFKNQKDDLEVAAALLQDAPVKFAQFEAKEGELRQNLEELESSITELKAAYKLVVGEIEQHQNTLSKLPQETELTDKQHELNDLIISLEVMEKQLTALPDVAKQILSLETQLNELGDPRKRYHIAESIVQQRDELEKAYAQLQTQITKIESELEENIENLTPFDGLDQEIEVVRQAKELSSEGYRQYIAHEQSAASLQDCQALSQKLHEEKTTLQARYDSVQAQYTEQQEQYDEQKHQEVIAEQSQLTHSRVEIETRIGLNTDQLTRAQTKLHELRQTASDLSVLQEKAVQLNSEKDAFNFVRNSIRDAGEKVRSRLVQSIGQQADTFFKQIMDDATHTLIWSSDYGITLTYRGETRPFKLLSGGEQMIAALSVRLALLTHMTRVRFVFLDEPTTNLDDKRRVNLAERLSTIQSLRQIFVISHDDTFEQGSNHIVEITKVNGISKVVTDATL